MIETHGNAKSGGEGGPAEKDLGLPALPASGRDIPLSTFHFPLSTFYILKDDLPQEVSYVLKSFEGLRGREGKG